MRLVALLSPFTAATIPTEIEIARLTLDSRQIQPQDLFIALKGTQVDGRQYISDAIARGASAVLTDAATADEVITWQQHIPIISIPQLTEQLGFIAAHFYGEPAQHLRMIGVTGTNGKTSCSHYIAQCLQQTGERCGVIGTLGSGFYGALGSAGLTTPDAVSLQALLAQFYQQGATSIAMEVSSHSIHQQRINAIPFEIGVFTNLSQDHLDYHHTMANYAAVKRHFMLEMPVRARIINADDQYGARWLEESAEHEATFAYALAPASQWSLNIPLIYPIDPEFTHDGIFTRVHTPWGEGDLCVPLLGEFNLSNALAVLAALCVYGMPLPVVLAQLARIEPVVGRMQCLGGHSQPLIVVDYAHTPDALANVLRALRSHTAGQLICIFGCGGDRDQEKRPMMASIVEQIADKIIVTNDNPRNEDPQFIAQQILAGFNHPEKVVVELDRASAIKYGIQSASERDCVLIAGKGAEQYQQIGRQKIPFSDAEEVEKCLGSL